MSLPISLDGSTVDAIGRQRVSLMTTLFDSKLISNREPAHWTAAETFGSGTSSPYNDNEASVTMKVSANTAGTRIRQTYRKFNCQPGRSHFILTSFLLGNSDDGITKRAGLFDDQNGIFLQHKDGTVSIVIRSYVTGSAVDTVINQSNWNVDTMNEIDWSKIQLMLIEFAWFGISRLKFGFLIGDEMHYAHIESYANDAVKVVIGNPNLPVRYEISNSGASSAVDDIGELTIISTAVAAEGDSDQIGSPRAVSTKTLRSLSGTTNTYALLSIRHRPQRKMHEIRLSDFQAYCSTTDTVLVTLYLNATLSGNLPSFAGIGNSNIEYATYNSEHTISDGIVLYEYFTYGRSDKDLPNRDIPSLGSEVDGTRSIITVAAKAITTNPSVGASIAWRELI